jgi:hypothetical protein
MRGFPLLFRFWWVVNHPDVECGNDEQGGGLARKQIAKNGILVFSLLGDNGLGSGVSIPEIENQLPAVQRK